MALADWTPERIARFEAALAALAKVNGIAQMYAAPILHHTDTDRKRLQLEDMHSALRFRSVIQGWDGQEVPETARVRLFMQEWYQREGMHW